MQWYHISVIMTFSAFPPDQCLDCHRQEVTWMKHFPVINPLFPSHGQFPSFRLKRLTTQQYSVCGNVFMVDHYTAVLHHNVKSINHMVSSGRYAPPITYNLILLLIIDASDVLCHAGHKAALWRFACISRTGRVIGVLSEKRGPPCLLIGDGDEMSAVAALLPCIHLCRPLINTNTPRSGLMQHLFR